MSNNKYISYSYKKIINPFNSNKELTYMFEGKFDTCPCEILDEIKIKDYTPGVSFTLYYYLDLLKDYIKPDYIYIVHWISNKNIKKISFVITFDNPKYILIRKDIDSSSYSSNILYFKNIKRTVLSTLYILDKNVNSNNKSLNDFLIQISKESVIFNPN